jgi:hypothetical protein
VQATRRYATTVGAAHGPDPLTGTHLLTGHYDGGHGLILGADAVRMHQHHHPATGHRPGEPDHSGSGGLHRNAR